MKVITAIIAWGINKVIKGITVTALIARRINNVKIWIQYNIILTEMGENWYSWI